MSGGTSVLNMLSSLKNNRNIKSGRSKLGDNPYSSKSIEAEKRNSTYTKELIDHRFERKDSAIRLTKWVYVALGFVIMGCLAYFLITN
ncbi:hypothetical protein [Aquiflexum gelatinilyticum]|uniref:Uncharacterized protein n=1 Tax=Aquiflexum gelatinilyticum TaxID=2961943 RepID=A0A9X2P2F4_9BACT|nr:hypothetical protein [Aquiflexum gelatinilyticum]MCR9014664.1 hypothetical protein [Aquiflexum gelatinilyticum]